MERNDCHPLDAHDAIHVIGDVLHDPSVSKDEMFKLAHDYYYAEFAGKREMEQFCVFVGVLLGMLCNNLETARGVTNGAAN